MESINFISNIAQSNNQHQSLVENVYYTRSQLLKIALLVKHRQSINIFKLFISTMLIAFVIEGFVVLSKLPHNSNFNDSTFLILMLYSFKDILIVSLNIYSVRFIIKQGVSIKLAQSLSTEDFSAVIASPARALNLSPYLGYLINNLNVPSVGMNLSNAEYALQLSRELKFFHSQNKFYLALTYLHYGFNAFLFIFTLTSKPYSLSIVYLQEMIIGATTILPLVIIIAFYGMIAIASLLLVSVWLTILLLIALSLFIFSPGICLWLRLSEKNDEGLTNFEVRMRQSLITEECAICLENYALEDQLVQFPCHATHRFHQHCGIDWWKNKKNCPLCREDLSNLVESNLKIQLTAEPIYVEENDKKKIKRISVFVLFWRYSKRKLNKYILKCFRDFDSVHRTSYSLTLLLMLLIQYCSNV